MGIEAFSHTPIGLFLLEICVIHTLLSLAFEGNILKPNWQVLAKLREACLDLCS